MYHKVIILSVLAALTFIPLFSDDVFGHGLGADQAPPIDFAGMLVTVSTMMTPSDITVGEVDRANLQIRFFDQGTDTNLESVTYRVQIFQAGELLAREIFYDKDGELNVQIRPQDQCFDPEPWRCTIYQGAREGISGGLYAYGSGVPVIQGPIFTKGGLYNISVVIEGATSPKTLVAEPLEFNTFVSIAQDQYFSIPEAFGVPVTIKTYYDDVSNFGFKASDKSISFQMPFDWTPDYIELVAVVHEEIRVPKSYEPYSIENDFVGYVDGVQVDNRALLVDPYSSETENIIHFLVTGSELKRINDVLGPDHYDNKEMFFELVPQGQTTENGFSTTFENGYKANVAWKRTYGAGSDIPFQITFFDDNGELLKDVNYAISLLDPNGQLIYLNVGDNTTPYLGVKAAEGIDTQTVYIASEGIHIMSLALTGTGITDWENPVFSNPTFEIGKAGESTAPIPELYKPETSIPGWIKNNAGWWADGQIDDGSFVSGLQWLISNGIMILTQETAEPKPEVKSVDLTISSSPILEKYFAKYVDVFGVPVYATSDVPDDKVLHAAQILAQYLDNDADGTPDNPLVVEKLKETNSAIPLFANEWEDETSKIWDDFSDVELNCWIALYADETNPRYGFDASLEEILHVITQCGYGEAYPEIFAEKEGSALSNAMTNAIESRHYNPFVDERMPFGDQHTEYIYWALTSILGAQENRLGEIGQEWKLNTKEKIMEGDPDIYNLLTEPEYKFPTILPDGNYQG